MMSKIYRNLIEGYVRHNKIYASVIFAFLFFLAVHAVGHFSRDWPVMIFLYVYIAWFNTVKQTDEEKAPCELLLFLFTAVYYIINRDTIFDMIWKLLKAMFLGVFGRFMS